MADVIPFFRTTRQALGGSKCIIPCPLYPAAPSCLKYFILRCCNHSPFVLVVSSLQKHPKGLNTTIDIDIYNENALGLAHKSLHTTRDTPNTPKHRQQTTRHSSTAHDTTQLSSCHVPPNYTRRQICRKETKLLMVFTVFSSD